LFNTFRQDFAETVWSFVWCLQDTRYPNVSSIYSAPCCVLQNLSFCAAWSI